MYKELNTESIQLMCVFGGREGGVWGLGGGGVATKEECRSERGSAMGEGVKGLFLALPTVHFFFGTLCSASLIQLCGPSYLSFSHCCRLSNLFAFLSLFD